MAARRLTSFSLDGRWFGIDVAQVQEVLPYQAMTRVPLAPPAIEGLINLRGQILMAISLRRRLGLAVLPPGKLPMSVVVDLAGTLYSLLVDEVGEVLEVDEKDFEAVPATLQGKLRELTAGAYKLPMALVTELDTDKLIAMKS